MRKKTNQILKAVSSAAMAFGLMVVSVNPAGVYAAEEVSPNAVLEADAYASETASEKEPYKEGDDISDGIFYIAVDADGNGKITDEGDAVYYYTLDEIKGKNEKVAFYYGNHGEGEMSNVIGAKLSTLLSELKGVEIGDDWVIQYMEEDAFHAANAEYQDTVKEVVEGTETQIPMDTMIGWANMIIYDVPDANNVNDTDYVPFTEYDRELSYIRAYRQTGQANSSVLKLLKGVLITNKQSDTVLPTGECGYQLVSVDANGNKIADNYEVLGLLEGMKWTPTRNVDVPWADVVDDKHDAITIGADAAQEVEFVYEEKPFFEWSVDGAEKSLKRSELAVDGIEYPETNVIDGVAYTYFGYNKPMYERYQGKHLKTILGSVPANAKVYIVKEDGSQVDITNKLDDIFVAYYYTQSKKSTNISNSKRVPLNFDSSVLVDVSTADIEYSNGDDDYEVASGIIPVKYMNARIQIETNPGVDEGTGDGTGTGTDEGTGDGTGTGTDEGTGDGIGTDDEMVIGNESEKSPARVTGVTASLVKYNSAKVSWTKVKSADKYVVEYKTASANKWKSKTVTSNSATIKSLTAGKKYQFRVKACIGSVKSEKYSAVKTVTTLKTVTLTAKPKNNKAKISFTNISGETGYEVYQKIGSKAWKKVKTLKANKVTWTSSKLTKGKLYRYKVRAYKTVGGKKVYGPWSSVKEVKR